MTSTGDSGTKWWYEMWYKPPKLHKKPNSRFYHYRWHLPPELQALNNGKTYVTFSLKTADEREAHRKNNQAHEQVLSGFEAKKRDLEAGAIFAVDRAVDKFFAMGAKQFGSMDEFCRMAMMALFFVEAAANANEAQAPYVSQALGYTVEPLFYPETTNIDLAAAVTRHRVVEASPVASGFALRETAQRLLAARCWDAAQFFVKDIVPLSGHRWPQGSEGYNRAAELFLKRLAEYRFEHWPPNLEAAMGAPIQSSVAIPAPAALPRQVNQAPIASPSTAAPPSRGTMRLSELKTRWANTVKPELKSISEAERALRRFTEVFGDPVIAEIGKQTMIDFRDLLFTLPSRPRMAIRQLSLNEQAAVAGEENLPRLSAASVEKYFGAIRAMLGFAASENLVEQNVAAGIRISYEKTFDDARLPFTESDLATIFSDEPLTSSMDHFEELFWFNVLGPLTGLRIEEMAALRPQNIKKEKSIWYIAIERDPLALRELQEAAGEATKRGKTKSALRNVPIHPILLEMDFVGLALARGDAGSEWLFPHLKVDKMGDRSKESSRRLNRRLRRIGITDREKVFYSHRHAMKRALRDDDRTKEEIADLLAGHSSNSVGRKYGKGAGLQTLNRAVRRLNYPPVDWQPVITLGQQRVEAVRTMIRARGMG